MFNRKQKTNMKQNIQSVTKLPRPLNKSVTLAVLQAENGGKPVAEILAALYTQHGSQTALANALGVKQGTVSLWFKRHGVRVQLARRVTLEPAAPLAA